MTDQVPPLPPRVVEFISAHITSLLQLEALLLVFEGGSRTRGAKQLAAELYLPEGVVETWLGEFAGKGFCEATAEGFRLADNPRVADLLREVADTYLRRKVSVGRLIFGSQDARILLAEAFRLRGDR